MNAGWPLTWKNVKLLHIPAALEKEAVELKARGAVICPKGDKKASGRCIISGSAAMISARMLRCHGGILADRRHRRAQASVVNISARVEHYLSMHAIRFRAIAQGSLWSEKSMQRPS